VFQVLVRLREQHVPVLVDLVQRLDADSRVSAGLMAFPTVAALLMDGLPGGTWHGGAPTALQPAG